MTITAANMTSGLNDTPTSPETTASIAFANNRLYILTFSIRGGTTPSVTGVTGGGITWAQTQTPRTSAGPFMSMWHGLTTSGATTGTASISWSGGAPSSVKWIIDEFAVVNTSSPIVQTVAWTSASNSDVTINLSAFADAVNNASYLTVADNFTDTFMTPEAGWTQLGLEMTVVGSTLSVASSWKLGQDTTATMDLSTQASNLWAGSALEIAAATANPTRKLRVVASPQRW